MCGVIGLFGAVDVFDSVKEGLKALEYRGYDSCGLLLATENEQHVLRTIGSSDKFNKNPISNSELTLCLGHNRWATHGAVCLNNTHPFETDKAYAVHNGVVENTQDFILDTEYAGNTDTEKVLKYFSSLLDEYGPEKALQMVLEKIDGMSVFVFVLKSNPNRFYFLRKGLNSLYLSKDKKNDVHLGLCSDANVLEKWFESVYVVQDGQCGYIDLEGIKLLGNNTELVSQILEAGLEETEKTHKTWLRTEIDQQSAVLPHTLRSVKNTQLSLKKYSQICFIGCGSAFYAGCIAKDWAQSVGLNSTAILASEFVDVLPILDTDHYRNALYVFISQSGQTLETIEAASIIKDKGYETIGVINTVNSALYEYVNNILYTNAGVENSVASTKGFTSQLMALGYLIAQMSDCEKDIVSQLKSVSEMLDDLKRNEEIRDICSDLDNLYLLSKGIGVDIANEISLKIKELTYISTQVSSSSEFKHGPLSLVDEEFVGLVLNPSFGAYERIKANIMEITSRGGKILVLTDKPWEQEGIIFWQMPETTIFTAPFLYVKAGQELAYSIASKKQYNIDQPRNLVKSVTVI